MINKKTTQLIFEIIHIYLKILKFNLEVKIILKKIRKKIRMFMVKNS